MNTAKHNVTAMFPVMFAPPGKNGNKPNRFEKKINKNAVSKYGKYFLYLCSPIEGTAMSFLINEIKYSTTVSNPFGACPSLFFALFAPFKTKNIIKPETINIAKTFFVIEKSNGFLPV